MANSDKPASATPVAQAKESLVKFESEVKDVVGMRIKSKTAMIRMLMPSLERMNQLGFTQEHLVSIMVDAGLDMSLGQLKTILWREKKKSSDN